MCFKSPEKFLIVHVRAPKRIKKRTREIPMCVRKTTIFTLYRVLMPMSRARRQGNRTKFYSSTLPDKQVRIRRYTGINKHNIDGKPTRLKLKHFRQYFDEIALG